MLRNVICTGRIMLCLLLNGPFIIKTGQRRRVHALLAEDPYSSKPIDLRPRCPAHLHACRQHEHLPYELPLRCHPPAVDYFGLHLALACIPVLHRKMFALVPFLGRPGCLEHLIVLRFFDSFFDELRTLAPPFAILVFAKRLRRVMPD